MSHNRVIMMGTSEFAVPALKALDDSHFDVVCVVCQPDKPAGRGHRLSASPVKKAALSLDLPVYQPDNIKTDDAIARLSDLNADVFVVASYGQILSQAVLDIPAFGCVNIHGSLLPKYRGAAPIHRAIIAGETETGVTFMKMDAGMDTGDMLKKAVCPITDTDTVGIIHDRLAELGAEHIVSVLDDFIGGHITPEAQDNALATYADKIDKTTGRIDWQQPADKIIRLINGTDPYPAATTDIGGKRIKCFKPVRTGVKATKAPGTVMAADSGRGLIIAAGDEDLIIEEIQVPGKKRMASKAFFLGNTLPLE